MWNRLTRSNGWLKKLQDSMEVWKSKMMHDNIGRRIQEQCRRLVCFLDLVLRRVRWSLLRFVVAVFFYFHYANDYIMASHMFLLVLDSIRG
jgi:hypothetical protein